MIEKLIRDIVSESAKKDVVVGLISHKGPDYDALSSTIALSSYLRCVVPYNVRIVPLLERSSLSLESREVFNTNIDRDFDFVVALDVNEQDRVYGIEYFGKVSKEKRYLFDHHFGNRVALDVLDYHKVVNTNSSSTCEIVGREILKRGTLSSGISSILYHGIVSDTVGFKRQTTDNTLELCNKLNLSDEQKKVIFDKVVGLNDEQKKLLSEIKDINIGVPGLTIYSLRKDESFKEKMALLKHEKFEERIAPESGMSVLVIDCCAGVFLKIRKASNSNIDIVKFAEYCNGGGHSNRTAGRFFDRSYEDVIAYVVMLYESLILNKGDNPKVLEKTVE